MTPSRLAAALRLVASRIEASSRPSRALVGRDLRRILANMGTTIVIDTWASEAVRTSDPAGEIASRIRRHAEEGNELSGEDGEPVEEGDEDRQAALVVSGEIEIDGLLLTQEEGSEGVAVGFDSSARAPFAMPWPAPEGAYLGNGDVTVYATAGRADGEAVPGREETLPEEA